MQCGKLDELRESSEYNGQQGVRDASVIQHKRHIFTERGTHVRILTRAQQGTWVECHQITAYLASYSVMLLKNSSCMFWKNLSDSRE
jgi:hypothetical protein